MHLGPFELGECLADGGNSRVYRAQRGNDSRPVVLKTPRSDNPGPRQRLSYRKEYESGRRLQHCEGIIHTVDLIDHGNSFFLVLEDIGAKSLRHCAAERRFDIPHIAAISARIARALAWSTKACSP